MCLGSKIYTYDCHLRQPVLVLPYPNPFSRPQAMFSFQNTNLSIPLPCCPHQLHPQNRSVFFTVALQVVQIWPLLFSGVEVWHHSPSSPSGLLCVHCPRSVGGHRSIPFPACLSLGHLSLWDSLSLDHLRRRWSRGLLSL